jgi:hypothetical protein
MSATRCSDVQVFQALLSATAVSLRPHQPSPLRGFGWHAAGHQIAAIFKDLLSNTGKLTVRRNPCRAAGKCPAGAFPSYSEPALSADADAPSS